MRNAISMNFCIPTFDFCAAGFPTRCQFDRLTEGFWPKNINYYGRWPEEGGDRLSEVKYIGKHLGGNENGR